MKVPIDVNGKSLREGVYRGTGGTIDESYLFVKRVGSELRISVYLCKKEMQFPESEYFGQISRLSSEEIEKASSTIPEVRRMLKQTGLEQLAQSKKNKTGPECSVHNPGYSNMGGRPTGYRHDSGFDDYNKGFSNYHGPSGYRHG